MAFIRNSQNSRMSTNSRFKSAQELIAWARNREVDTEPLDIAKLANELGITVRYEVMNEQISGKLNMENGRWIITVNSLHHPNRQRFTIAHELGHFMLHTATKSNFEDQAFFRGNSVSENGEKEANRYAADLLMPKDSFDNFVKNSSNNVGEIAQHFQVSSLAVRYRAKDLGYRGHNL